jgi:hypothetical protein
LLFMCPLEQQSSGQARNCRFRSQDPELEDGFVELTGRWRGKFFEFIMCVVSSIPYSSASTLHLQHRPCPSQAVSNRRVNLFSHDLLSVALPRVHHWEPFREELLFDQTPHWSVASIQRTRNSMISGRQENNVKRRGLQPL